MWRHLEALSLSLIHICGDISDFVAVGNVKIQTIGADNQILDSEVPVRQMLEQIIALSLIHIFFAVGLFSYKMVRPLREMAEAARCFGSGDFSRRVPVTSDDEIGELAVAFNNMAASLSSSEGTRRSFIANVSHELKTPMTTIAGFIDGILAGTIPPDKQNYYLKIVSDEVKRLSRLVKTMLDLSRIDNGELRMKMCIRDSGEDVPDRLYPDAGHHEGSS